jgi:acyl-coenzyme A thioesterase PaaI-like protein
VSDALFEQRGGGRFEPTEHSLGPWGADLLHGGPVAALLARQLSASATEGSWFPSRLTVELMRPVSLSEMAIETTVLRAGRKAQLVAADCVSGGNLVARAALQLVAVGDVPIPSDSPARSWSEVPTSPWPDELPDVQMSAAAGTTSFHRTSVEHRSAKDLNGGLGPGVDWIRVRRDLLPDEPLTPFERVVCAADFSNGISTSLRFEEFSFVNADLSLHVFRLPVDEWVRVDAISHIGDQGVGLAESTLADQHGLLGHACQSLVVVAR